ncbi:phosphate transport system regulatory protein PhoU [Clostridium polyendosporum]|uniref:Phosphate-specific transport system accessory protein PhoU n=1 Tax=Clostridium polyendosporum TaxID=69208 RepID=A0A919RWR6_9CLOT|nr:phosphate signaling complex protein PhoU [Clostridium polyendosporum]GIM27890.1 phosphate transport system regulatory protein PhoU [Clostridium polyendosporum]
MTRGSFDTGLQVLHDELVKMGSIVEKQIHGSVEALVTKDVQLAEKIIKNDDLVDNLQKDIEDKCIKLIATMQPLAKDLRNIFTTTKIVTDLERMADHAVDIAKITKRLKDEKYIKELVDIPKMADIVQKMIRMSIDAYIDSNVDKAYEICKMDDEVDGIYKKIFNELIGYMNNNAAFVTQASQLLFVCKYLERIADHVTNICEWTIYLITGNFVDLNE